MKNLRPPLVRRFVALALLLLIQGAAANAQVIHVIPGQGQQSAALGLDMRTLGIVPGDPGATAKQKNLTALINGFAARVDSQRLVEVWPAGQFYFGGTVPVNSWTDPSIFNNVSVRGQYRGVSAQHEEDGGDRSLTQFLVDMPNETDIWWNQIRTTRFGPISFADLSIRSINRGSLFSFGDQSLTTEVPTLRGLNMDRLYLSRLKHYGMADIGDGRAWLINDATNGYVLNRTNQSFGLRMSQCYDVDLNLNVRGWKYGIINQHGDACTGTIRGITNGITLLETNIPAMPSGAAVGSHWRRVYAEAPILAGAVLTGQAGIVRSETYPTSYAMPPGVYSLPVGAAWRFVAGADSVEFTAFPGSKNCLDWFEPFLYYRFTPTTVGEPPLDLFCTKVDATHVYGLATDTVNYVARTIQGVGTGVQRHFGVPVYGYGSRFDGVSVSTGVNQIAGLPVGVVAPQRSPIRIAGNSNGRGDDPDSTQPWLIIGRCAGIQEQMWAGVDLIGSSGWSSHPLANPGGIGPMFGRSLRSAIWDPNTRTQLFKAGRGVSSVDDVAKRATFHPLVEEDGTACWGVRPSDCINGSYELRGLWKAAKQTKYSARIWVPAGVGAPNCQIWGGAAPPINHTLAAGWQTISNTLSASQMVSDANGPYVLFSGSNFYLKDVVLDQN